jgi:hypothetical protein
LNWFLHVFGHDVESMERDEVDERQALGLERVVKISNVVYDKMRQLRFDGFAPAGCWEEPNIYRVGDEVYAPLATVSLLKIPAT